MKFQRQVALCAAAICLLLGGCAHSPNTLYQWEGYETRVDAQLQGKSDPQTELQKMQDDLKKIQADGGKVPPGYMAHMGLLYGQQGQLEAFADNVKTEKSQYPESGAFMDFLLRNFKK